MTGRAWWPTTAMIGCLAAAASAPAKIEHVIQISVDGLRGDALHDLVNAPSSTYVTFRRLQDEGASTYNARCDFDNSDTVPNHCGMVTGRPVAVPPGIPNTFQHGYTANSPKPGDTLHQQGLPPGYKASTFDRVHDRGLKTALLLSKVKLTLLNTSYDADHGAPDADGADNGRNKIDEHQIQDGAAHPLVARLVELMDAGFPNYTFLHLVDPDLAGHSAGWGSLIWKTSVKTVDTDVGMVIAALDARPSLKATTAIVLTADHGGGGGGITVHVDPTRLENVVVPFFVWGPGVPAGQSVFTLLDDRFDPGTAIPPVDAVHPPLRNTDAPNIALALLGLPPIAGSYFQPTFHAELTAHWDPSRTVTVTWPLYLTGETLEATDSLTDGSWSPIRDGITEREGKFIFAETRPERSKHFFRLRRPQ